MTEPTPLWQAAAKLSAFAVNTSFNLLLPYWRDSFQGFVNWQMLCRRHLSKGLSAWITA
ncbi:MAG: hypothetical protein ACK4TA_12100 [Saprospiraceae bacterium]